MSTIVAPAKPGFAPPRGSPLNPQALPRSTPTPRSLRTDPHTHLSNLDRLLLKKSPPPPPPPQPAQDRRPAKEPIGDENEQHGYGEPGGGIFHALNLNTIIPSLRKASTEAMSPRSLAQLQRLLSSPRLSPKNPIASRWRLLHGASDWDGLLDPLDENLRRELTRYGDLVQAAYHAFHSNPAAAPHHRRDVILPDRSYRVTKSLYATSSVDLPRWVAGAVAPWMTQRSSWFGYVAVCDNEREIGRMGRRDVVIALRGTATCLEWAENFRAGLVPLESGEEDDDSKVANGFLSLYKTSGPGVPSLSAMVVEEVRRLTELYKGEELSITITGHSLGGAIALLVADELTTRLPQAPPIAVFSFGGPKVGNRAFADRLDKKGVKALRVVNSNDVVPRVPGVLPREELGRRIGRPMDGYAHFGAELRVDSRSSPYLKPDADPNCCHDLESYLHLVDGFVDRDCPFRSDAKRSLVRLFELQRPNLKKLCVTQARAMGLDRLEAPAALASPSQVGYLASPSA